LREYFIHVWFVIFCQLRTKNHIALKPFVYVPKASTTSDDSLEVKESAPSSDSTSSAPTAAPLCPFHVNDVDKVALADMAELEVHENTTVDELRTKLFASDEVRALLPSVASPMHLRLRFDTF
jgi:hypothetical protein